MRSTSTPQQNAIRYADGRRTVRPAALVHALLLGAEHDDQGCCYRQRSSTSVSCKVAFDISRISGLSNTMVVRTLDDSVRSFPAEYDAASKRIVLIKERDRPSLTWSRQDPTHVIVVGTFRGTPLTMRLRRIDQDLLLVREGLHWANAEAFFNK